MSNIVDEETDDNYYNQTYDERITPQVKTVQEVVNLRIEDHSLLNVLFYIRLTDNREDEVVKIFLKSLKYILKNENKNGKRVVEHILMEKWLFDLVRIDLRKLVYQYGGNNHDLFKIWPVMGKIDDLNPDINKLLQTKIDIVYTLGGDGTLLSLLRQLYKFYSKIEIPKIAAFNLGSLGYLCNFKVDEYAPVIDSTIFNAISHHKSSKDSSLKMKQVSVNWNEIPITKGYRPRSIKLDKRMRIIAQVKDAKNYMADQFALQALNEIQVTRGKSGGIGSFDVYINTEFLTTVQGDGILISTPTGSTAYNLSCGGSIVHNSAHVFCLTPICPHSLSFRPIILDQSCEIVIRLNEQSRQESVQISIDGHVNYPLKQGENLYIKKSPFDVPFLRWSSDRPDKIWATKLNDQLKWNTQVLSGPQKKLVLKAKL